MKRTLSDSDSDSDSPFLPTMSETGLNLSEVETYINNLSKNHFLLGKLFTCNVAQNNNWIEVYTYWDKMEKGIIMKKRIQEAKDSDSQILNISPLPTPIIGRCQTKFGLSVQLKHGTFNAEPPKKKMKLYEIPPYIQQRLDEQDRRLKLLEESIIPKVEKKEVVVPKKKEVVVEKKKEVKVEVPRPSIEPFKFELPSKVDIASTSPQKPPSGNIFKSSLISTLLFIIVPCFDFTKEDKEKKEEQYKNKGMKFIKAMNKVTTWIQTNDKLKPREMYLNDLIGWFESKFVLTATELYKALKSKKEAAKRHDYKIGKMLTDNPKKLLPIELFNPKDIKKTLIIPIVKEFRKVYKKTIIRNSARKKQLEDAKSFYSLDE